MDIARAVELLDGLAQGVNPFTGEILPEDCVCNQVEIVRALYCVLNALKPLPKRGHRSHPENAGKPWTQDDDDVLLLMFENGCESESIEECLQRTEGAIAARLVRLGKIESREEYRRRGK